MNQNPSKNADKRIYTKFLSIILAVFAYFVAQRVKNSPSMPRVTLIFEAIGKIVTDTKFYIDLLGTLKLVLIGVGLSLVVGFAIATLCSLFPFANGVIMPIINSTKNIPSIALFPLFIILMGIGDEPRVFVIVWNSLYPIISTSLLGLTSVDQSVIDAAQNCGANKWQEYIHIRVPLSLINVMEGLKISISNGFIAIVVAEMLGATQGLGFKILWMANAFRYPEMYAYILIIAVIGFALTVIIEKIIRIVERRMFYA